jgi:hypothetical protein
MGASTRIEEFALAVSDARGDTDFLLRVPSLLAPEAVSLAVL